MNQLPALFAPRLRSAQAPSPSGQAPIEKLPRELKRLIVDYVHTADLPHLAEAIPSMRMDPPRWSSHPSQLANHYPAGFLSGDPVQAWCLSEQLHRAQKNLWQGHLFTRQGGCEKEIGAGATTGDVLFHLWDENAELTATSTRRWPLIHLRGQSPNVDRETGEWLYQPQAWAMAESPSGRWLAFFADLQPGSALASTKTAARALKSLPVNKTIVGLPQVSAWLSEKTPTWLPAEQDRGKVRLLDLACYPPSSIELCSGSFTQGSDLLFSRRSTHLLLVHRQPDILRVYGRLSLLRLPSPIAAGAWCALPHGFRGEADVTPLLLPEFPETVPWIFASSHDRCAAFLLEPTLSNCQALRLPLQAPPQRVNAKGSVDWRHLLVQVDAHFFLLGRAQGRSFIQMDWVHPGDQQVSLSGVSFRFLPDRLTYSLRQSPQVTDDWFAIDCTNKEKQPRSILTSARPIDKWSWCGSPSTLCDTMGRLEWPVGAIYLAPRDDRFVLKALLPREGSWTSCLLSDELMEDFGEGISVDVDRANRLLACSGQLEAPVIISLPADGRPASSRLFKPLVPATTLQVFFSKLADVVLATIAPKARLTTVEDPNHANFVGTRPNPLLDWWPDDDQHDSDDNMTADGVTEEAQASLPLDQFSTGLHAWRTNEEAFGESLWFRGIEEGHHPVQSTKDGTAFFLRETLFPQMIDFVG